MSPLRARSRYRELVKRWHPDRFVGDAAAQREATRRIQEITEAYGVLKDAARHRQTPLRPPAPRPWPAPSRPYTARRASEPPRPVPLDVDTPGDRVLRFVLGALAGLALAIGMSVDGAGSSAPLFLLMPLACGVLAAGLGSKVLEWLWWALWWVFWDAAGSPTTRP